MREPRQHVITYDFYTREGTWKSQHHNLSRTDTYNELTDEELNAHADTLVKELPKLVWESHHIYRNVRHIVVRPYSDTTTKAMVRRTMAKEHAFKISQGTTGETRARQELISAWEDLRRYVEYSI